MEEIAFPRGDPSKKKKDHHDEELIDTNNNKFNRNEQKRSKRRKRKKMHDEATAKEKEVTPQSKLSQEEPTPMQTDILFGAPSEPSLKNNNVNEHAKKKSKTSDSEERGRERGGKQSLMPVGGGGVTLKQEKNQEPLIEPLAFDNLKEGTKLLGIVRQIHDDFAVLALPNMLSGFILQDNESIPMTHVVSVGQYLSVTVTKTTSQPGPGGVSRRRIQLSADPSYVNPREELSRKVPIRGRIISVEDHGCLIDLGFKRKGFVTFDRVEGGNYKVIRDDDDDDDDDEDDDEDDEEIENSEVSAINSNSPIILRKGRLYDFIIAQNTGQSGATYPLALKPQASMASFLVDPSTTQTLSLTSIRPGWLIKVKLEQVAANGLCVSFFDNIFRASVEINHLGAEFLPIKKEASQVWKNIFSAHHMFQARIVAVDEMTRTIRLSLQPHVLKCTIPDIHHLSTNTVIDECKVIRVEPGVGAILALPDEYKKNIKDVNKIQNKLFKDDDYQQASQVNTVFVPLSKAVDITDRKNPFIKKFSPSTIHKVRIVNNMNWVDGIASGACTQKLLDSKNLSYDDLKPGQKFHQARVVKRFRGGSVIVDLGLGLRGIIPSTHLPTRQTKNSRSRKKDTRIQRLKIGDKIDVLVLSVDPAEQKCMVTAKDLMVNLPSPEMVVISKYNQVKLGQKSVGYVSKVDNYGLYVSFCGIVYGRVTKQSLEVELGIADHHKEYATGDVVQCRVIGIKKCKRKLVSSRDRLNAIEDGDDDYHEDQEEYENEDEEDDDDVDMGDNDDKNKNEGSKLKDDPSRYYWRLLLSLNMESDKDDVIIGDGADGGDNKQRKTVHLRAGAILPMKSMKILRLVNGRSKNKKGDYIPGYAIVAVKSKYLVDGDDFTKKVPFLECKLPYDQLMDQYDRNDIETSEALDALAEKLLVVGKKINQKGILLTDPQKSDTEYKNGVGKLTIVSIKKQLVQTAEEQGDVNNPNTDVAILPTPATSLYIGANLRGFVAHIDPRYGAFIRFLEDMTGLVPIMRGGLNLPLFRTVTTSVEAIDDTKQPKQISLTTSNKYIKETMRQDYTSPFEIGQVIPIVEIVSINFFNTTVRIVSEDFEDDTSVECFIHCALKDKEALDLNSIKKKEFDNGTSTDDRPILKYHPFYKWKVGMILKKLKVASVYKKGGKFQVFLTDREVSEIPSDKSSVHPGMHVSGIVTSFAGNSAGLHIQMGPTVKGFLSGLELTTNIKILNNLHSKIPIGSVIKCCVMKDTKQISKSKKDDKNSDIVLLSHLLSATDVKKNDESSNTPGEPTHGNLVVGMINRSIPAVLAPALMLHLRGGYIGRCCITELDEPDDWVNMPLGKTMTKKIETTKESSEEKKDDAMDVDKDDNDDNDKSTTDDKERKVEAVRDDPYPKGKYVQCRVLEIVQDEKLAEVSLRPSRIEGDLDQDETPKVSDIIPAFVVRTIKAGCFVRMARHIQGRVMFKELADGFLRNPEVSFPPGRLVVGKVKKVEEARKALKGRHLFKYDVDFDLRESSISDIHKDKKKLSFNDIELNSKHKGVVTRVESFGVFVKLDNSNVSGLAHLSECSDKYIKNLHQLYDPGDLVKVLVIKKDEKNRIAFSMKASHFENDEDSDDDDSDIEKEDEIMDSDDDDVEDEKMVNAKESDDEELDSNDENFATKLARKMAKKSSNDEDEDDDDSDDDDDDSNEDDDSSDDDDSDDEEEEDDDNMEDRLAAALDTDVGFEWGPGGGASDGGGTAKSKDKNKDNQDSSSSDDDDSDSESIDGNDNTKSSSTNNKSRKKQAQRRREEQEISRREAALADGTVDQNPETAGDFERLIAADPNSSELWIRYMAFHLSLADIASARVIADRAFDRIEFRQEREKLNVWTALLTLELKYGTDDSLQKTTDRACQHNNPKQVYLRLCELLEKEVDAQQSSSSSVIDAEIKADKVFAKMCSKFKSKKKVWIAHLQYLLKRRRHQEAHELLKRALQSLASYKHAETMARFAQLEFEFGSVERARTLYEGILLKYPKRLDMFFVYLDKEVKFGTMEAARAMLEKKVNPTSDDNDKSNGKKGKLTDKQMKSLFKKWFRLEEQYGTPESQEHVKQEARRYVERTSS